MTAPTRSTIPILASVSVPAGGSKAAPAAGGTGAWVDVRGQNGGQLAYSVKNGSIAPGVQGQFTFQVGDGNDTSTVTNVTDLWTGGGTTVGSDETTGLLELPATASFVRMLCYGHTTNAVTFRGTLFAKA